MENNNKKEVVESKEVKTEVPKRRSLDSILCDIKEGSNFNQFMQNEIKNYKF